MVPTVLGGQTIGVNANPNSPAAKPGVLDQTTTAALVEPEKPSSSKDKKKARESSRAFGFS
jgi:hypothetical protein